MLWCNKKTRYTFTKVDISYTNNLNSGKKTSYNFTKDENIPYTNNLESSKKTSHNVNEINLLHYTNKLIHRKKTSYIFTKKNLPQHTTKIDCSKKAMCKFSILFNVLYYIYKLIPIRKISFNFTKTLNMPYYTNKSIHDKKISYNFTIVMDMVYYINLILYIIFCVLMPHHITGLGWSRNKYLCIPVHCAFEYIVLIKLPTTSGLTYGKYTQAVLNNIPYIIGCVSSIIIYYIYYIYVQSCAFRPYEYAMQLYYFMSYLVTTMISLLIMIIDVEFNKFIFLALHTITLLSYIYIL